MTALEYHGQGVSMTMTSTPALIRSYDPLHGKSSPVPTAAPDHESAEHCPCREFGSFLRFSMSFSRDETFEAGNPCPRSGAFRFYIVEEVFRLVKQLCPCLP